MPSPQQWLDNLPLLDPENPVPGFGIYTGIVDGHPNVAFQISYTDGGGLILNALRRTVGYAWWFNVETGKFETFNSSGVLSNEVVAGLGLVNVRPMNNLTYAIKQADITYKGVPVSE